MDIIFVSLLALVLGLLSVLYWLLHYRPRMRLWAMAEALPGPKTLPIIGNLLRLRFSFGNLLVLISPLFNEFGPLVREFYSDKVLVFISHPDDAQSVLGNTNIRNRSKFITRSAHLFVGQGLLTSRDEDWKIHRKLLTPMFHFKILETYVDVFVKKSRDLVDKLDQVADGTSFNVYDYLAVLTLESIMETAIGSTAASKEWLDKVPHILEDIFISVYNKILLHTVIPDWLHSMVFLTPREKFLIKPLNDGLKQIISHKVSEYRSGVRRPGITTSTGKNITSFLDMMVEASETQGSILSQTEMEEELATMALVGMETTATTMSFFLLLVAIHRDIQNEVYNEMVDIFGESQRPPTYDDVMRMDVLDRVIKETLRLFPIASASPREITQDIKLQSGHVLPEGCEAIVMSYVMHRNEQFFPKPNKFCPDRWLAENSTTRHPFAYLPFAAGPRNCIGQKYATLQMKTTLSTLLRRYDVTTNYKMEDLDNVNFTFSLSLAWPQKYEIQLKKR